MERLKAAACAAQAALSLELDEQQRRQEAAVGVPVDRRGRGVPLQVGLARGQSPHQARALLGAARIWAQEMPHTFTALASGHLDELRAVLLVRETACLPVEARAEVDRELCADPRSLHGVGVRRLLARARACAARLDPAALVRRAARAENDRCVTIRPAPDAMVYLTALLPVAQGVGAYAALRAAADTARQSGDPRSRGQVMADTLTERLTGRTSAPDVPVTVNLVVSDRTLLAAGTDAAHVDGYGPIPAQVARNVVAAGLDAGTAWLRRIYTTSGGDIVASSSTARFHPPGLAALLRVRDQGLCRTPYCDAPARESDHITPFDDGGETSLANGQALCQACNLAKQARGFTQHVARRPGHHTVVTTTPTGHEYTNRAPAPPGCSSDPPPAERGPLSGVDLAFARLLDEAA
ncbi:HNH endonuclease [Cellulomonas fulva]|uniref:HNH endonuclease n=1 Tax=Cellulomonas fulva TaxID=2835530 RepID=UPI001F016106|nr:HNH endonuclease [Cellulomonas fulva]